MKRLLLLATRYSLLATALCMASAFAQVPLPLKVNPSTGAVADPVSAATFRSANAIVGTTDTQTLTNKTLTSPVITGGTATGLASLYVGAPTAGDYGITPLFSVAGSTALNASENSVGADSHPTPGRVWTVSGVINGDGISGVPLGLGGDDCAIGIDLHPILTATADDQALVGIWVDPSGPLGESQFNPGSFSRIKTCGIYNKQSLNQLGYSIFQGDVVGGENGSLGVGRETTSPIRIFSIGNLGGFASQTYDIGSSSAGQNLTGLVVLPVLKNTAAGTATRGSDTGIDVKVSSKSVVANTLTSQTGIHVQDGIKDANTTITNKYGILVESISGGTTENYGIKNLSATYTTGLSNVGTQTSAGTTFLANAGWNPSSNAGSAIRISHGASSGDTYSIIQSVDSGNSSLNDVVINPYGGSVGVGTLAPGSTFEVYGAGSNFVSVNGLAGDQQGYGWKKGGVAKWSAYMPGSSSADLHFFDGSIDAVKFKYGGAVDIAGTVTAPAFSGPLTGNVTGNVSGTAPAGTLTGSTLSSSVTSSSLTSFGTAPALGDATATSLTTTAVGGTLKVKSGSNAKAGTFTLVAGAATVSNTSITANSVIHVTVKTVGGTRAGDPDIVPTVSTGFTAAGAVSDTSTYNYWIEENN